MPLSNILILAAISWQDRIVPMLIVAALLAVAIVIGYANFQNARAFRIDSTSSLAPENVLDRLQAAFARDGWVLGYRDSGSLVMSIDRNARLGSTAALGCFSVWMTLVYLATSNKRITVEIDVTESMNGSVIVTNGNRSGSYLHYVAWHLNNLPKQSLDTARS